MTVNLIYAVFICQQLDYEALQHLRMCSVTQVRAKYKISKSNPEKSVSTSDSPQHAD